MWLLKRPIGNGSWQTRSLTTVRNPRQHAMSFRMFAFSDGGLVSMKPPLRIGNSFKLVYISTPRCFFCSCWWCLAAEENKEETSGHRSSPMEALWDCLTDFLVEPIIFTIAFVDPDIAGKRVGENNCPLFSCCWPADGESILPIVLLIIDTTSSSTMNAAIAGLRNPSRKVWDLWGCWEEPDTECGLHSCNVTPVFNNNTAARWVKVAMKFNNQFLSASFIMANKLMAHLVPRHLCVEAAAAFLWMISCNLRLRISSTIPGRNGMMMLGCGAWIQEASWQRKQASKRLNDSFNGRLLDSSDTLKSS